VTWSWTDAWLLTAAYVTNENRVTLTALIGAGDALNHAIFTDVELEQGLAKLSAAGLAQWDGNVITLTEKALHLCGEAVESTQYIREAMSKIDEELRLVDLTAADLTPIELDTDAVDAAIAAYHARARAWLREHQAD
jgi:hypothetical protein